MTADRFHFRCWDIENKHMFYDGYNNWKNTHIKTHDYLGLSLGGDIYRQWEYGAPELSELTEKATDKYILMQSTGLIDKNGKEIFEGDIVEIKENDGRRVSYKIIKYSKYDVAFYYTNMNSKTFYASFTEIDENFNVEVIGNIYENEELLKKEDYYIDKNGKIIYGF